MTVWVYTLPNSGVCTATVTALDNKNIPHKVLALSSGSDLTEDVTGAAGLLGKGAIVVIKDKAGSIIDHWLGFWPDKIDALAMRLQTA